MTLDVPQLTLTPPAREEPPLARSGGQDVPFTAIALFCDDVRLEASGKLTLVGHYVRELCQLSANTTMDRCAIYLHATWPWRIEPREVALRVDLPGGKPTLYRVSVAKRAERPAEEAAPEVFLLQSYLHLRFPPLQDGDRLRVFLRVDGTERPAGRLDVRRAGPRVDKNEASAAP